MRTQAKRDVVYIPRTNSSKLSVDSIPAHAAASALTNYIMSNDVIFVANGRLLENSNNNNNQSFLQLLLGSEYAQRTRLEKPIVAFEIVEAWKKQGGRFVYCQENHDEMIELADTTAREYVGRLLRRMHKKKQDRPEATEERLPNKMVSQHKQQQRRISTQLDYARDGILYGRQSEQAKLNKALELATDKAHMAVISGASGVGKTALAHSIRNENIIFAQGKFEQPFHISVIETSLHTALVQAVTTLVLQISVTERHRQVISEMVDASVLQAVVPAVASHLQLMEQTSDDSSHGDDGTGGTQPHGGKVQALVLASLLRLISLTEPNHTVVLLMDDLQWADEASLDVLVDLFAGIADTPRILLLFTDRDESNDSALDAKRKRFLDLSPHVQRIMLNPLSEETVTSMLSGLLKTDPATVESISQFFWSKTGGNAAFVCELLRKCQEEDALVLRQGEWRCDETFMSIVVSEYDNMVDLYSAKVQALPERELSLLKAASCLGSVLEESILQVAVQVDEPLNSALATTISQRLIVYDPNQLSYCFVHDGVHEAVYHLLGDNEREIIHLRFGKRIFGHLEQRGKGNNPERLIDVGLSQLIRGSRQLKSHRERVDVAKLCLQVGQRAFSVQGFHSSAAFLQHAISLLGDNKWQTEYPLCLQLHNLAAEVAYCTGKQAIVRMVVDETLANARCLEDSLSVRATKVYLLGSIGNTQEAIEIGLAILRELGVKIPIHPSPWDVRRGNWSSRRIRKASDADILCLPFMQDTRQIAAMNIMNLLMFNAWKVNPTLMNIIIQNMVLLTLDGGLTSASAPAFGWYGAMLCV